MKIRIEEVTAEKKQILENLVSLYLHELSAYADDLKINEEGKFVYDGLEYYFKLQELKPFFVYCEDEIAGFILLNSGRYVPEEVQFSVHELFILKSYRKKGVATKAIEKLLEMYKGIYKIVQLEKNKNAINFWHSFYVKQGLEFKGEIEVIDGFECYSQIFWC